MARDVEIRIRVNDSEVVKAEDSLNRLNKAANDLNRPSASQQGPDRAAAAAAKRLGISYDEYIRKVKLASGVSKQVETAVSAVSKAAEGLASKSGKAASGLSAIGASGLAVAGVAAAAAAAIAAVTIVAVKLGQEVFRLAKEFAAYGVEIGKAMEETGLAAETISALRLQLERTGRSVDLLNAPLANFRKTIGQAVAGSEEARAKLNLLGLDGRKAITDIDTAFRSAVATIVKLPPGAEQTRAAFAAFGDEGYTLLPFFQSFNGNVDEAIKKADELGQLLSGRDVRAAQEFNRAYTDLQRSVDGLTKLFGREFLPIVTKAITDFTGWLNTNKEDIKSWAEWSAEKIKSVVEWWISAYDAFTKYRDAVNQQAAEANSKFPETRGFGTTTKLNPQLPPLAAPIDANKVYGTPTTIPGLGPAPAPDPAALEAARREAEKRQQETIERAKRDFQAAIESWSLYGTQLQETFRNIFKSLEEDFARTGNAQQFRANFEKTVEWYLAEVNKTYTALESAEDEQARRNKVTDNEWHLLQQRQLKRRLDFNQTQVDAASQAEELIKKQQEKASNDRIKQLETEMNRAVELRNARNQTDIAQATRDFEIRLTSERQYVDRVNTLEMDSLTFRRAELEKYLKQVVGNKEKEADVKHQIKILDEQIAQQQIRNADRVTEAEHRKQEALERLRQQYEDFKNTLEDQLTVLQRGNRPLTVYEQTMRALERDYRELSQEQKEHLLDLAKQIDLVEELNKRHAELKEFFKESLTYIFEGDVRGLLENLQRRVRDAFVDRLSDWLATTVLGFDPNQTDNPVAKPIVNTIRKSNEKLDQIIRLLGGKPGTSFGIPGLGGLNLGTIFGGNAGGGIFNFGGSGSTGSNGTGTGTASWWDRLKGIFSTDDGGDGEGGQGGIFQRRGGSRLAGIVGGIGDLATVAGGLIGGRVGGIISAIGTGASIGAAFGPWGAAIGAAIGGIIGLFGGDPKRKRDKNEKIPALNRGFADAIKELNDILAGVRTLSIDPDEALGRANDVRAQIAGGFGIQFESRKYRQQAQQLISQKLRQADTIIEQIKSAAEIARGSADRSKRILPEFARGHYFADFFRPNGLLPGVFDGRDNILAMISRGEMVLNPSQQGRVRALAGFDVFAGAGIPNYPKATSSPQLASGGIAGAGIDLPAPELNLTVIAEGVIFTEQAKVWVESDDGRRVLGKFIKKETTASLK